MKYNFKILGSSASFQAVEYNAKKEKQGTADLLYAHNFPDEIDLLHTTEDQLRNVLLDWSCNKVNDRFVNLQFHATITAKGKGNDLNDMKNHAMKIMEHLGYGDNPIYMYAHSDTDNDHLHIVTSRVDQAGIKIDDSFERTRANSFLCELLKLNVEETLKTDLKESLSFNFSSANHFLLLMEQKGYQHKTSNDKCFFFKHGKSVGSIKTNEIKKYIEQSISFNKEKEKKRLFAIINSYKKKYSSNLDKSIDKNALTFRSELTDMLKKDLGIEFVFFGNKNHDKPYGYVIIDHADKTVYKGSDILSLSKLITNNIDKSYGEKRDDTGKINVNDPQSSDARSRSNKEDKNKEAMFIVEKASEVLDVVFDFADLSSIKHSDDDFSPTSTTKKKKKKTNALDRKQKLQRSPRR